VTRAKLFLLGFLILGTSGGLATADSPACELEKLEAEAAAGDPVAQYNLGIERYRGECIERDLTRAAALWRSAAAAGSLPAHNSLGYLTFRGHGVPRDPAEAFRLWRFAAERGHPESQFFLASAYMTGREIARDYVLAYAWASASVHYAELGSDLGADPEVASRARLVLREVKRELSDRVARRAEEKAREFIASFGPRNGSDLSEAPRVP
jgi:TPR repeat protein